MQTAKPYGQFENFVFKICAIRENARLIARCPYLFPFLMMESPEHAQMNI